MKTRGAAFSYLLDTSARLVCRWQGNAFNFDAAAWSILKACLKLFLTSSQTVGSWQRHKQKSMKQRRILLGGLSYWFHSLRRICKHDLALP